MILFLENQQNAETYKDAILPAADIIWIFSQFFVFCEFGERLTDRYNDIYLEICCLRWYKFPRNILNVLLVLLNGTQEPVVVTGFGNLEWTRESFKMVH